MEELPLSATLLLFLNMKFSNELLKISTLLHPRHLFYSCIIFIIKRLLKTEIWLPIKLVVPGILPIIFSWRQHLIFRQVKNLLQALPRYNSIADRVIYQPSGQKSSMPSEAASSTTTLEHCYKRTGLKEDAISSETGKIVLISVNHVASKNQRAS